MHTDKEQLGEDDKTKDAGNKKLLDTAINLDFLLQLKHNEFRILVA